MFGFPAGRPHSIESPLTPTASPNPTADDGVGYASDAFFPFSLHLFPFVPGGSDISIVAEYLKYSSFHGEC